MNIMAEKRNIDNRKYKLIFDYKDQHKYFQDTYTYLSSFFESLWDQPSIIAKLITNSELNDIKNNLSFFFMNNFYENILSSSFIEDELLYVITLVLSDEIGKIKSPNDYNSFLDETACGYFLEKLNFKMDVMSFYKIIMENIVKNLENISSSKKINFNVKQIQEYFDTLKDMGNQKLKKTGEKINMINNDFFRKNFLSDFERELEKADDQDSISTKMESTKKKEEFNSYMPDLTKEDIVKALSENKDNKGMKEYCDKLIENFQNNPKIYSNDKFLDNVLNSNSQKEVLALYQIDFFKVLKIIDQLFNSLINNIYLIPYSVKCICKIISILAKKKFKNLNIIEHNILLSKFFFKILLLPAFKDPKFGSFINNFIISGNTIDNLQLISNILEKFLSFDFIKNDEECGNLTPFNRYFLKKMPNLLKLFDDLPRVKLPSFIEKMLNNCDNKISLDYFKENNEEIISHRSICFSIDEIISLLNNIEKCKDLIFTDDSTKTLRITFEKIYYANKGVIEELKKNEEFEDLSLPNNKKKKSKQKIKILNFFLFTKLLINDKYKNLFELSQEKPNFTLKELQKTETDSEIKKNNIIKVKNLFSGLLYNYRNLVKTDFNEGTTINTFRILKELKIFMKSTNYVIDGSIPSEWYVDSLFEYLKLLPEDLKINDYENLYNSLIKDVNNSMKEMDFETMSFCLGKVKFANRGIIYYENMLKNMTEIEINEKVQSIIENSIIPVEITLNCVEKEFKIEKTKWAKDTFFDIFKDDNIKRTVCNSIESFGNKFPNIWLEKKEYYPEIDMIEFETELNLAEEMTKYFNIVREHLIKKMKFKESQEEFEIISNKIYDFVMEKIYEKIYPLEPAIEDNVIFTQCILVSWIEPKHLISGKNNYIFDSFLPDVMNSFAKIDQEKSPRKKLENMINIFTSIENVVKFNGENKDLGVDDQLPILNYAFIKANPFPIYTNCKFMELFLGQKKYRLEGNYLTQLFTICKFVENLSAEDLFDISEEQFKNNCLKSRDIF